MNSNHKISSFQSHVSQITTMKPENIFLAADRPIHDISSA